MNETFKQEFLGVRDTKGDVLSVHIDDLTSGCYSKPNLERFHNELCNIWYPYLHDPFGLRLFVTCSGSDATDSNAKTFFLWGHKNYTAGTGQTLARHSTTIAIKED